MFFLIWLVFPVLFDIPEYLIPNLMNVLQTFLDFLFGVDQQKYSGEFWIHAGYSIQRVVIGFIIASSSGVILGVLSGYFTPFFQIVDPFIQMLRSIPGIGWLPLAIVWFGVGTQTTLFLISLVAFFPVYINTVSAVRLVPQNLINVGKVMRVSNCELLWTIILPSALPGIFTGIRICMGLCWSFLVLGEMTGVNWGLGAILMNARMLGSLDMVVICMICIAVLGKLFDFFLTLIYKAVRKHAY
ncbi:ABC transporter permease [Facklamia sp. DSM 111018]|uniref:ABC transporter permease n=1 Tax=Facklamia lactis TaxID=2749967 RepID=A0ABS0LPY2_9LACT|nr:ABC transporter permease [Facklamia lactis]MBG9985560.1 ABC transporter permease [Facklamia lactis]